MYAIASLLVVIAVGLLITRIATVMLVATGLSRETARFQARSAFTGSGFTTQEAEAVVSHPVRRRIVSALMLLGNAGLVTVLGSLVLGFTGDSSGRAWSRVLLLACGLLALTLVARSVIVDRFLTRVIRRALSRWTDIDTRDYAALLELGNGYSITELAVRADDWVAGRSLGELSLRDEGIAVLGIERGDGSYRGTTTGSAVVRPGDTLILYGRHDDVCDLGTRPAGPGGDDEHRRAVAAQEQRLERDEPESPAAAA
jgi:hypothetical protein